MKDFHLKSIPHEMQRYETVGDYQYTPNLISVTVSKTGCDASDLAIAIHEAVEAFLCERDGIPDHVITTFDIEWDARKQLGEVKGDEAGHDPESPYRNHHRSAESVERSVVAALGLTWDQHSRNIEEACK